MVSSQSQPAASEKLHKYIARCGVTSRRNAELLIKSGNVAVDGKIIDNVAERIIAGTHTVMVYNKPVTPPKKKQTFILYKPPLCVSTLSDPEGRNTIVNYFPKTSARLFPIGRLDYDTQGIMIVTNDGALAQSISHPSNHIRKTYYVKVRGVITPDKVRKLDPRPVLDGKKVQRVTYKFIRIINDKTWLEIILQEGLNRQIKKMFALFGYDVLKIKRISIGAVHLGDLEPGQSRPITQEELDSFGPQKKRPVHPPA